MRDLWQEIVLGVVGTVLFALATKLLMGKRRIPARPGRGGGILRYPVFVLMMSVFAVVIGLTALVVNGVKAFEKDPFSSVFVFIGFPVAGTLCATMYFRVRFVLVPGGMRYQPMWRRKASLSWAEVTRLRFLYPHHQRYFRIDAAGEKPVKLSLMLTGLPEFARTVLAQVPAAAIDDETRYALEQLKAGFLPPEV